MLDSDLQPVRGTFMINTVARTEPANLPLAPKNPLPYRQQLKAVRVLHEALRLCPPAGGTMRMLTQDIEVDGYRVEAGTFAVVAFYALHRDPALWDNPLTFDPDRFLPERSQGRSRWQYLPFGGGPRSCIGDHFAVLEATLALATVVRNAHIESVSDDFPLATPFTVIAAAPILATVRKRSDVSRFR